MSSESTAGKGVEKFSLGNTIDIIRDPKDAARARINEFLGLTPRFILEGNPAPSAEGTTVSNFDAEQEQVLAPNQVLARAMLGLESAVTILRQEDPPIEKGETVKSEQEFIDGKTGLLVRSKFRCGKAGSDFGTVLKCDYEIARDEDSHPQDKKFILVMLPSDRYLVATIDHGNPHEPQHFACETDVVSEEWSEDETTRLPNGGFARRVFDSDRLWFDDEGNFASPDHRKAAFRRDRIDYLPLYAPSAPGLERYVEITQQLLWMLVSSQADNRNR